MNESQTGPKVTIRAKDYRNAKLCKRLFPVVLLIGGIAYMVSVFFQFNAFIRPIFLLMLFIGGVLFTKALKLRTKPYTDYEIHLAIQRGRRRENEKR